MDEYLKKLPRKRMGAGILLFNGQGELLILKTSYKDYWSIPGGVVEENESPREGCLREVTEEIGLELTDIKFVCVDYNPHDNDKNKDESLQFIFSGGQLSDEQIGNIKIDEKEIIDHKFVSISETLELLGGTKRSLVKRLPACLETLEQNKGIYLEDGKPLI